MHSSKILLSLLSLLLLTSCRVVLSDLSSTETKEESSNLEESSIEESSSEVTSEVSEDSSSVIPSLFNKKRISLYGFVEYEEPINTPYLSQYYLGSYNLYFLDKTQYVPYIPLDEYIDLYSSYYRYNHINDSISINGSTLTWSVKTGLSMLMQSTINLNNKEITILGGLDNVYKSSTANYSRSSIYANTGFENTTLVSGGAATYSYLASGYEVIYDEGDYYFPLSMLEAIYGVTEGLHTFYNYQDLFIYDDYYTFASISLYRTLGSKELSDKITPLTDFNKVVDAYPINMPTNIVEDNYHALSYLFDNHYGLRNILSTSPFKDYATNIGIYEKLLSGNRQDYTEAIATLLKELDDGHTGMFTPLSPWFVDYSSYNHKGVKRSHASEVLNSLTEARNNTFSDLKSIYYSTDGSLAYFVLDSFSNFAKDAYISGTNTLRSDLYLEDDYYYLLHQLETIVSHNEEVIDDVSNVVIDISTNGGGIVQSMMKMVSLLSSSNTSPIYIYFDHTGEIYQYQASISQTGFGGIFNFYILTSEYSYSCANAFPFALMKNSLATIIGQTSGGGECALNYGASLPLGVGFAMSSNMHIGYYDGSHFLGNESGATVIEKWQIDYSNFYNLDYLANLISINNV
ncbi:MAG: hypothetical protein K5906_01490 [Bacilli bacterium]|nr:hypothetical protein [Bacilli bacterium]